MMRHTNEKKAETFYYLVMAGLVIFAGVFFFELRSVRDLVDQRTSSGRVVIEMNQSPWVFSTMLKGEAGVEHRVETRAAKGDSLADFLRLHKAALIEAQNTFPNAIK